MMTGYSPNKLILPDLPGARPLPDAVFFGFDKMAFPFQEQLRTHLSVGRKPELVLGHGAPGSHDEVLLYYGTVIKIGGAYHMWYNGNYGPPKNSINYERKHCCICYARSADGVRWEKPDLGLVEFNGSKHNNIVDFRDPHLWSSCAMIHEPDEPDENKRFKMMYETIAPSGIHFNVSFSKDGFHWVNSPKNPVGPAFEMAGVVKIGNLYYVNGQTVGLGQPWIRKLDTFVSADFERWSQCAATGLDRAPDTWGPSVEDHAGSASDYEEIHIGSSVWDRGNVFIGFYGQWHGHHTGDRAFTTMDLGFALTHDAIHFTEPIPGYKMIPAREQPERPVGPGPALMQGQGMENIGDKTFYWYSLWRGTEGSGVRAVTWERDRLGMLKPYLPWKSAQTITSRIKALGELGVTLNASGLGEYSHMRISLLDEAFIPIPGYSGDDAAVISENGFSVPVVWKGRGGVPASAAANGIIRIRVEFDGVRREDGCLHALYLH